MAEKKRLDLLIQEKYPELSRNYIQSIIMQAKVTVNGKTITKAGTPFAADAEIMITDIQPKYVSRAGFKLEKALDYFAVSVEGLVALDAGISTGGFTDCLLQRGIAKVYGVDVGYGQVHEKIAHDSRVVLLERMNLRHLGVEDIGEGVDLVTLDLSFISVLKVMDVVAAVLKEHGQLIVLIKPQFEAERHDVGSGGIITDPEVHKRVVDKVTTGIQVYGFQLIGVIPSPITGSMGNTEFLAYFKR